MERVSEGTRNRRCHVSKKLLPVKAFFFFFVAGNTMMTPFVPLYMKQINLTSSETGILQGVMYILSAFIRPAMGVITDRWQSHRLTLIACTVLTGVFHLLLLAIPARQMPGAVVHTQLNCDKHDSYFTECSSKPWYVSNQSACRFSLSSFVDVVANANNSDRWSSLDCNLLCSDNGSFTRHGGSVCFTDTREHFAKDCNGTITSKLPLSFQMSNLSRHWNVQTLSKWIQPESGTCRNYSPELFQLGEKKEVYKHMICDEEFPFECEMTCRNPPPQLCQVTEHEFDSTFRWFFLVFFLARETFSQVFPLIYGAGLNMLGTEKHKLGLQRVWGSVGFIIGDGAFVVYSSFAASTDNEDTDFIGIFSMFGIVCVISAFTACFLNLSDVKCGNMFKGILAVMQMRQVYMYLFINTFFGLLIGAKNAFLFWYLSDLGASQLLFGITLFLGSVLEIPTLALLPVFTQRFGAVSCLYCCLLANAVQFGGYSLLGNPWPALLIEPLHTVTIAVMWVCTSVMADQMVPPSMSATMQGVINSVTYGIGAGVGSLVTGFLFDHVGGRLTFALYAVATVAVLAVYVIVNHFVFKSHSHHTVLLSVEEYLVSDPSDPQSDIRTPLLSGRETPTPGKDDPGQL